MRKITIFINIILIFVMIISTIHAKTQENIIKIGDINIYVIDDCKNTFKSSLFPDISNDKDKLATMPNGSYEGVVRTYLIQTANKNILIDTGWGNTKNGKTIEKLASLGIKPDQITDILLTHLDIDHISGLIMNDRTTFPNATIHISEDEYDAWIVKGSARPQPSIDIARKNINLYKNKLSLFKYNQTILPNIIAYDASGHTKGHTMYYISSNNNGLYIVGDLLHVAPLQLRFTNINSIYDAEQKAATTRFQVLEKIANEKKLIAGMHFFEIGYVQKKDQGFIIKKY